MYILYTCVLKLMVTKSVTLCTLLKLTDSCFFLDFLKNNFIEGFPWWSSNWDSTLLLHGGGEGHHPLSVCVEGSVCHCSMPWWKRVGGPPHRARVMLGWGSGHRHGDSSRRGRVWRSSWVTRPWNIQRTLRSGTRGQWKRMSREFLVTGLRAGTPGVHLWNAHH